MSAAPEAMGGARSAIEARPRVGFMMAALLLSTVLASLDSSFVPIAFPDMIDDLDTSTSVVVWVALGYLIAATGPMLLAARFGDAIGHARLFQIGTLVYAVAMIACTWAPSIGVLVGLRLVQGIGMALFLPATFAIAARIYAAEERGKALGLLQSGNAFGFVLGPVFAGWLLDAYDWRAIFGSRIPFAVLAILLAFAAFGVRHSFRSPGAAHRRYDLVGAAFLTLALFGLLFGFNRLPVEDNHRDLWVWGVFAAGAVFAWLFLRQERRSAEPLIDLGLFRESPPFARASVAFTAIFASFPVYLFVLPIVMISGLEIRAWDVGMVLAVAALCTFLISPVAGRAADRFGPEYLTTLGILLVVAGYLLFLTIGAEDGALDLILPLVLIGVGTGCFFSPNNALLLGSAPPEKAGMVSGMIGTLRQTGYAVGFAVVASLFTAIQTALEQGWTYAGLERLTDADAHTLAQLFEEGGIWSPEVLIFVLHATALLCVGILVLSLVNSWPRLKLSGRQHLATLAASLAVATAGVWGYTRVADLRMGSAMENAPAVARTELPLIAPFGHPAREVAARGSSVVPGGMQGGERVYAQYCAACHGAELGGVDGLGVALGDSGFVAVRDVEALMEFIRQGRMPDDPDSVSGGLMPGFPTLPEAELRAVAEYLEASAR